jgi:hypothetical protein
MQQFPNQPQFQPPKLKTSNFIPIFLGVSFLFVGSCGAWLAYAVHQAQTPEGKRAAKEADEKNATTLDGFVTKMDHVRAGLPPRDAPAVNCAAGTKTTLAPVVDTFFFDSLHDGRTDAENAVRQDGDVLNRDSLFSDSILDAELIRAGIDAGPQIFSTSFAVANIDSLSKDPIVLVLDVDTFDAPATDSTGFIGGELEGSLDVVDWKTDKTICNTPISVKSSDNIEYGGGMKLTFHGIPSPTIGKTDLDKAIAKDFEKNVEAQTKIALASTGVKN